MRAFVEVIGSGHHDCSSSVQLFFDDGRYLFECGDGTQRLCTEYGTKLSRMRGVYLSSLSAPSIGGVFGFILTVADAGKKGISICAPVGLSKLFNYARTFCHRPAFLSTFQEIDLQTPASSVPVKVTEDTNVTIEAVPVNLRRDVQIDTAFGTHSDVVSYICHMRDLRGKFNPKKAMELGVSKGHLFGLLQKGQSVPIEGGIVHSADVMSPATPGAIVLIIACPLQHHIHSLTTAAALQPSALNVVPPPPGADESPTVARDCIVFHLAPHEVLSHPEYRAWCDLFGPKTTHVPLHPSMTKPRAIYSSQAEDLATLHFSINKRLFPLLENTFTPDVNSSDDALKDSERDEGVSLTIPREVRPTRDQCKGWVGKWTMAACKLRYTLAPATDIGIDQSFVRPRFLELAKEYPERPWQNIVPVQAKEPVPCQDEVKAPACMSGLAPGTAAVRFLGTGAAIPGKHRNVSGVMLDLFMRGGVLLDCGEGTWGQLVRAMGEVKAQRVVVSLRIVFISHMHADHHLGLMRLLYERSEAIRANGELAHGPQLIVIGPQALARWLEAFERGGAQTPLRQEAAKETRIFRFFAAELLTDPQTAEARMFWDAFGLDVGCVEVEHCPDAYGIVIRDCVQGWKVVYSGDTRPCKALAEAGRGATLAIHEATLDDEMEAEALEKMHCTTSEALNVCAEQMGAWRTILTHFSQRYPRLPKMDEKLLRKLYDGRAAIAFDFMHVDFTMLHELPRTVRAIRECFPDELEDDAAIQGVADKALAGKADVMDEQKQKQ